MDGIEFFPTDPHPYRTGTIIKEDRHLYQKREMDGMIFYDSIQVLDDPNKTLDIIVIRFLLIQLQTLII